MTEFKALGAIADQLDRIGTRNQLYYKFNYRQTFSHTDAKKYTTTTRAHPNQVHPRAVPRHVITIPKQLHSNKTNHNINLHQQHFPKFRKVFENKDPKNFLENFQKYFILTFARCILCCLVAFVCFVIYVDSTARLWLLGVVLRGWSLTPF
jgi:hypothetical protein